MTRSLRIAVVGAGSFVFGPSVLIQALVENRINDAELVLIDTDPESLELMAGVGRQMARINGLSTVVTTATDLAAGLDGADYVICSAARQLQRRHHKDREIISRLMPDHLVTEFGGIAGIGYSLRQIALIEEITDAMKRVSSPGVWFLTVSNPLPRVCQAAHENGIRTAGFCSVSISTYEMAWRIFTGQASHYPFAEGHERWKATIAGLNHFSWLVGLAERSTGEDALPELRRLVAAGATSGNPRGEALLREKGYLLTPGDNHTQDFLPALPVAHTGAHDPWHGDPQERRRRLELLAAIGNGDESWDKIDVVAWERPVDFVVALAGGPIARPHSVNLINDGQIPNLPRNVFVETACTVDSDGVHPDTIALPETVLAMTLRTAEVTDTIVRAARERSRSLVHRAVDLDPTIADKAAGHVAIDEVLAAHADILPFYQ